MSDFLLQRFDLNGCTVFEVFGQNIKTGDMARFLTTDDTFWKTFLSNPQTGFVRKARVIPYYDTIANATKIIQGTLLNIDQQLKKTLILC
jgi:hypothetical protein